MFAWWWYATDPDAIICGAVGILEKKKKRLLNNDVVRSGDCPDRDIILQ